MGKISFSKCFEKLMLLVMSVALITGKKITLSHFISRATVHVSGEGATVSVSVSETQYKFSFQKTRVM